MSSTRTVRARERWFPTLCVHFRKVNSVTRQDVYPVSLMKKCTAFLAMKHPSSRNTQTVSTGESRSKKEARDIKAFTSQHLYRFVWNSFELGNALSRLQQSMDVALLAAKWKLALLFLTIWSCSLALQLNTLIMLNMYWRSYPTQKLSQSWTVQTSFQNQSASWATLLAQGF